jgi:hypothetical protein
VRWSCPDSMANTRREGRSCFTAEATVWNMLRTAWFSVGFPTWNARTSRFMKSSASTSTGADWVTADRV